MKETQQDIFQLLNKLQNAEISVKDAASHFTKMKNVPEITKIFKDECNRKDNPINQKINIFFLMHEIIMGSKKFTKDFLAHFGNNLKEMLLFCCESHPNLQNFEDLSFIINTWEKEQIYVSTFIEKLRTILSNKASEYGLNINLRHENHSSKSSNMNLEPKVNKAVIRDYKLIQENEISRQIYEIKRLEEIYHKKQEELNKLFSFEDISEKLKNFSNPEEVKKGQTQLHQYKALAKEIKEMLLKIVEEYGDCFKKCSKKCDFELKEWLNFNYENYEMFKQQIDLLKEQSRYKP